jgi:hypothetical protein
VKKGQVRSLSQFAVSSFWLGAAAILFSSARIILSRPACVDAGLYRQLRLMLFWTSRCGWPRAACQGRPLKQLWFSIQNSRSLICLNRLRPKNTFLLTLLYWIRRRMAHLCVVCKGANLGPCALLGSCFEGRWHIQARFWLEWATSTAALGRKRATVRNLLSRWPRKPELFVLLAPQLFARTWFE